MRGASASWRAGVALALSPSTGLGVPALAADAIALGAFLSATLAGPVLLTGLLGLAAIAAIAVELWPRLPGALWHDQPGERVVGRFPIVRMLLAATVAVAAARADTPWPVWVFVTVTALVVVTEQATAALLTFATPYAAHVPGVRAANHPRVPAAPLLTGTVASLVAGFLAVTITPWLLVAQGVVALVAGVWWAVVSADAVLRIRARQRFSRELPSLLESLGPQFVLHWDAPAGTAYQVAMWLPELERIGVPYFVLVRSQHGFAEAAPLTGRPVILRRHLEDLDACLTPSLRAVFYVNNAIRNAHLTRLAGLTHVQLNHGDSDKTPSFNPVFRMYDLDFVAGQAAIDRFAANGVTMPAEAFRIVGRPQVRGIEVASARIAELDRPTVLYAPTWAGFNEDSRYSSLPYGEQIVRGLLDRGCRVIFRPHPYAYRSRELAGYCARIAALLDGDGASGADHQHGKRAERAMTLIDCFNAADAMISDVSSVVVDFLYSEKPMAIVAVSDPAEQFTERYPVGRACYILEAHGTAIVDLDRRLDDLLADTSMLGARRSLKTYYLGDIPEAEYADRFAREAHSVLAHAAVAS